MKLVALDVDGTLLNSQGQLTTAVKEQLKMMTNNSQFSVVLCTGRPFSGVQKIISTCEFPEESCLILVNGSIIRNVKGKIFAEKFLKSSEYQEVIERSSMYQTIPIAVAEERVYLKDTRVNASIIRYCWHTKSELELDYPSENLVKIMFCENRYKINKIKPKILKEFQKEYTCVQSDKELIEILPQNVGKGEALKQVASLLNISSKDIIAIGDNENDVSMFKFAGHNMAMGNATDQLKEIADIILPTNDQDGAAEGIAQILRRFT